MPNKQLPRQKPTAKTFSDTPSLAGRDQLDLVFLLVISQVPFRPVLTCPIYHWTAGILSVSVLIQTILSNARLVRSKLDEKGNEEK